MYRFDASRQPLYIVHASGSVSAAEIAELGSDLEVLLQRRAAYSIVWNLADADFPPREVISEAMAMTKNVRTLSQELYENVSPPIPVYTAYYLSPRLARLLQFFERMLPKSDIPTGIYASYEEAVVGAEQALEGMGLCAGPRRDVGS